MIVDLVFLLAVPAYLVALAAVVLLACRCSALRAPRPRRRPPHGPGAR